ncbi:MAG: AAA family ATPase [Pseudomonadota bacterium]
MSHRALQEELSEIPLSVGGGVFAGGDLQSLLSRALVYLKAGVPVHLRGPAGVGKTTLALHLAGRLEQDHVLISGDDALTSGDLIGRELGHATRRLSDSYIHSVRRTETESRPAWVDSVLARAMMEGRVVVYDEFTRAPAAANNAFLTALEERVLIVSNPARDGRQIDAHPDFRVIFTSNPAEYAGTNRAPNALYDRMITFDLGRPSADTAAHIVVAKSGLAARDAKALVAISDALLAANGAPTASLRPAIMVARILAAQGLRPNPEDGVFVQICLDVFGTQLDPADGPAGPARRGQTLRAAFTHAFRGWHDQGKVA